MFKIQNDYVWQSKHLNGRSGRQCLIVMIYFLVIQSWLQNADAGTRKELVEWTKLIFLLAELFKVFQQWFAGTRKWLEWTAIPSWKLYFKTKISPLTNIFKRMGWLIKSNLSGVKRAMAERRSMMFSSWRQTWWKDETNLGRVWSKRQIGVFQSFAFLWYCVIQPFCWFWRWLYSMLTSCAPRTSSPPACLPPKWRHWIKYIYSLTFHNLQNIHTEDPLVRTSRDLETKCRWRINFLELLNVHLPSILLRVKVYNGAKDH